MMDTAFNWDVISKNKHLSITAVLGAFLTACLVFFMPQVCDSADVLETFQFENRWPDASVGNLADSGGDALYFAAGNFLVVLSATDLTEESRLKIEFPDGAEVSRGITGIAADPVNPYVYLACGAQGIAIVDVSDPAAPEIESTLAVGSDSQDPIHASALDYDSSEQLLYVADVYFGLRCIDVSTDPPSYQWGYPQTSDYTDDVSGGHINVRVKSVNDGTNLAFVLDQYYGLRIFNVENGPSDDLASFDMRSRFYWGQYSEVVDVAVDANGEYAYVTDLTYGVTILDFSAVLSDPASEITNVGQIGTPGTASGLALSGDNSTLLVADGNKGLLVADVSDPEAAINDGSPDSLDFPSDLVQEQAYAATGSYAVLHADPNIYLANGAEGLAQLGDSDYGQDGTYDPPSDTTAVYADEGYAYIIDDDLTTVNGDNEGLRILDLGDTESGQPELTGFVPTLGNAASVAVHGLFAYVADGTEGVAEIDVSNKTAPGSPSYFNSAGNARDIEIWAEDESATAYIADSSNGLVIANVENDGQLTGIHTYPGSYQAVDIYEHTQNEATHRYAALIPAGSNELTIVEVTDPTGPVPMGSLTDPVDPRDVAVTYPYAVVADGPAGLILVDISNPNNLNQLDRFDTEGPAEAVSLYASYIHTAVGSRGVAVVGISDTDPPELTPIDLDSEDTVNPYYNTPGYASDVFIAETRGNRYTYVADDHGGFLALAHEDRYGGGINEQPFEDSPDDSRRIECFISSLFK